MGRERAYGRMLDASVTMQQNIAFILEAKALETEKVRNWICNHVAAGSLGEQQVQLRETMGVHDQLIEVIDGLAKLNQGMANVLRAALRHDQQPVGGQFDFTEGEQQE
ncbi:restriction endonuclease subunit S [Paenibacillus sp. GCM10027626]|uniref:restriction endonuclease subunit S n=1 Tax=Paenibacillus sp. GCM10027626 TaxID=3273411 RepID=UPI00362F19E0